MAGEQALHLLLGAPEGLSQRAPRWRAHLQVWMERFPPFGRVSETPLTTVFESLVFQAGQTFKYSAVESGSSAAVLRDALNLLVNAGIAYKVQHSSARGLPLGAQVNPRRFKTVLFDVGVHQRLLGLDLSSFLLARDFRRINRGHVAEAFVAQELLAYGHPSRTPNLHYWHREVRSSNAEVDYVIQAGDTVLPVEVKAGTKGQMQSIRIFSL